MGCNKLMCRLLGHKWNPDCAYREYKQSLGGTTTGFQLMCDRSSKWVKVRYNIFNKYYKKYCSKDDLMSEVLLAEEMMEDFEDKGEY